MGFYMQSRIKTALSSFVEQYIELHASSGKQLEVECDDSWASPCCSSLIQGEKCEQGVKCEWKPTRQTKVNNFAKLEQGMEMQIHQDFQDYFCTFWSDHLNARAARGDLQLLMVWNQDDFIRLQENLISHLLMKRRLGQRDTLFFAQTEDENYIISVLNGTGEVVLEPVGQEPREILARDLEEFICNLQPILGP